MWPLTKAKANRDFIVPTKRGPMTVNAYSEQEALDFAEKWSAWEDEEQAKREGRWSSPFAAWLHEGRPEGGPHDRQRQQ